MSRNSLVYGLLVAGLALAGCSSSSKSGTTGDGSLAGPDVAGQTASGDAFGAGGAAVDASAGSLPGNNDAMTGTDGSIRNDGGPGGDAKAAQPGDVAGGAGGSGGGDGGTDLPRDAREAADQTQPQNLPDGATVLGDAPIGQDVAQKMDGVPAADLKTMTDGISDSSRRDGPKDTGYCNLPDYGLSMPADQKEILEKFGLCRYSPTGNVYSQSYGDRVVRGTVLQLAEVERCVDPSDPQKGKATGSSYRMVLGSHGYTASETIMTSTSTTQRLYALKLAPDGTEVRAAYDMVSTTLPGGVIPDYPTRYARFDLVCGDASAFPEFDGWTGRVVMEWFDRLENPSGTRYWDHFIGASKDGLGDRAFYFSTVVLD